MPSVLRVGEASDPERLETTAMILTRPMLALLLLLGVPLIAHAQEHPESETEPVEPAEASEDGASEDGSEDEGELARALERYAQEPRIDQLLDAVAHLPELDPNVPRRAARRARRGGWLPDVRLALRRGQTRDLSEQYDERTDRTRVSTDDDLTLEASITVRLARAAYGQDEVSLLRESRTRHRAREERARSVIAAYFERRRLQLERDVAGHRDLQTLLRIAELEALLDAFTGGAFTRIMHSRGL